MCSRFLMSDCLYGKIHIHYLCLTTSPFVSLYKNVLSIDDASNNNEQHCINNGANKGKVLPRI